jgi:hypothetical protein
MAKGIFTLTHKLLIKLVRVAHVINKFTPIVNHTHENLPCQTFVLIFHTSHNDDNLKVSLFLLISFLFKMFFSYFFTFLPFLFILLLLSLLHLQFILSLEED